MHELKQTIRFCQSSDGARIAYATMGRGPPLVRAAHFLTHLEFELRTPVWRPWLAEYTRGHALVRYDQRGCGLSDREVADVSLEAMVADLRPSSTRPDSTGSRCSARRRAARLPSRTPPGIPIASPGW